MDKATRDLVRRRAAFRCEYCLIREDDSELVHHIEHIIARQHGGSDEPANLALACHRCNLRKGPNVAGIDPVSGKVEPLFHPRRDRWMDHFRWDGIFLIGLTPTGRVTVRVLAMNGAEPLEVRRGIQAGS